MRRRRRWLRRLGWTVLMLFVTVTLFSCGYNAATQHRAAPPPDLTYIRTGDFATRYRHWGAPDAAGPPVVLVHGFAEDADTWSQLAPLLAAGHQVYALDVDGFGYTQRKGPYDVAALGRQLAEFAAALHLVRPLLVGHSSGAAVVAQAALADPGNVGGVMFLDGDALASGAGSKSPLRFLAQDPYRTTLLRLAVRQDWLIRSIYSRQCGPSCPRLDAAGLDQWRRPFEVAGAESAVWDMLDAGVPGLSSQRLEGLRAEPFPKAVVFGAQDDVFSPDSPRTTAARIGAPPPVVIPGAHHLGMISHPAAVAAAVEALAGRAGAFG